jgi:hypothetical protein
VIFFYQSGSKTGKTNGLCPDGCLVKVSHRGLDKKNLHFNSVKV